MLTRTLNGRFSIKHLQLCCVYPAAASCFLTFIPGWLSLHFAHPAAAAAAAANIYSDPNKPVSGAGAKEERDSLGLIVDAAHKSAVDIIDSAG